jgi:hypothetical protein
MIEIRKRMGKGIPLCIKQIQERSISMQRSRIVIRWEEAYQWAEQKEISMRKTEGVSLQRRSTARVGRLRAATDIGVMYNIQNPDLQDGWIVGKPKRLWDWAKHLTLYYLCTIDGEDLTGNTLLALLN